jgi:hypothetical protein
VRDGIIPLREGAYWWKVDLGLGAHDDRQFIMVSGDSCQIAPSGALVISGSLPEMPILRAWGRGQWLSVEMVQEQR